MKLSSRLLNSYAAPSRQPDWQTVPFGDWLPDLPDFGNSGSTVATNVIPVAGGYTDFSDLTVVSDALGARCRGAFTSIDKDGNIRTFAATGTKLYEISTTSWNDYTNTALDAGTSENVEFAQFGAKVIATYYSTSSVEMQAVTLGNTSFGDLISTGSKPRGAHIGIVRDFVMLGRTYDASDGGKPQRVWWSAVGDETDWTPAAATQCDHQDLDPNDGWVMKIIGREYGTVVMEHAIYRATYVGGDVFFQFDKIVGNRGTIASGSVVAQDRLTYFLDTDGFYVFDGTQAIPIGKNKVDKTFLAELDQNYLYKISSAVDSVNSMVWWAYPATGNQGVPNRMIGYHWPTQRWSKAEIDLEWLLSDRAKGYTLESLDTVSSSIDTLTPSLDDRSWTGGAFLFSAVNTSHKLASFTGSALAATLETGEVELSPGVRTSITGIRPLVDGTSATTTIAVGTRDLMTSAHSFGTAASLNGQGQADVLSQARYNRLRCSISGGFDFAQGLQVRGRPAGRQ